MPDDDSLPENETIPDPLRNNNSTNNNVSSMTTINSPVVSVNITNENGDQISNTHEDNTGNADENDATQESNTKKVFHWIKIGILICVWGLFTGFLMTTNEKVIDRKQIAVPAQTPKGMYFKVQVSRLTIILKI